MANFFIKRKKLTVPPIGVQFATVAKSISSAKTNVMSVVLFPVLM